jgi:hypothetical protein
MRSLLVPLLALGQLVDRPSRIRITTRLEIPHGSGSVISALSSLSVLVALDTKSYEILSRIIAQAAPRPNVVDLEIHHAPARLATPAISLQNFTAELAISFRMKP